MKKTVYASVLAAGCSLLLAAGGIAAEQKSQTQQQREQEMQGYSQQERQGQQQARQQEQQKSQYAQQLMEADEIAGLKIQNQQGEEIGSVDKVVLDSQSGQIAYVVVTSGGFWGVGGEKAVIPWKAVQFQQQGAQEDEPALMVNVTKEQLQNSPTDDVENITDRRQAEEIHQFYGVAPYWEGQQQQQQQRPMMQQQREHQPMQQQREEQQQQREEQQQQRR